VKRLAALSVCYLLFALLAPASSGAAPSKDEANLMREAARLEKTAASPPGETAVVKRITKDFGVGADRVQALRSRGLGYGELAIALSLAQKMPGGMTDANIEKVTALRQGPPVLGWGEIAKQLHVKLGQVKKMSNEAHRELKAEHDREVRRPAPKEAEPAAPWREPAKAFSGEGKDMTRGGAAQ
jgi:hypothetical protein